MIAVLGLAAWTLSLGTEHAAAAPCETGIDEQTIDSVTLADVGTRIDAVYDVRVPLIRESVGMPVLNETRAIFPPVDELDGHRSALLKPKIAACKHKAIPLGYNGLGHDHYARADV